MRSRRRRSGRVFLVINVASFVRFGFGHWRRYRRTTTGQRRRSDGLFFLVCALVRLGPAPYLEDGEIDAGVDAFVEAARG